MTYKERISGDNGIPDVELQIMNGQPTGVLETYHVAVDAYRDAIEILLSSLPVSGKEQFRCALHRIMAGTAIYGYNVGWQAAKSEDVKGDSDE